MKLCRDEHLMRRLQMAIKHNAANSALLREAINVISRLKQRLSVATAVQRHKQRRTT